MLHNQLWPKHVREARGMIYTYIAGRFFVVIFMNCHLEHLAEGTLPCLLDPVGEGQYAVLSKCIDEY